MQAQVDQSKEDRAARAVVDAITVMVNDSLSGAEDADAAVASILISLTMPPHEEQSEEEKVRAVTSALWLIVRGSLNAQVDAGVARILILKLCSYAGLGIEYRDFVDRHQGVEAAEAASHHYSFDGGVRAAHEQLKALLSQFM